ALGVEVREDAADGRDVVAVQLGDDLEALEGGVEPRGHALQALVYARLDAGQHQRGLAEAPRVPALGELAPLVCEEVEEGLDLGVVEAGVGLGLAPEPVQLAELVGAGGL